MIDLQQNQTNNVIVTLRELTSISNPYYLFEFTSQDTNESKIFTGVELSQNVNRYNKFNIELTSGAEDLLNSVINLPIKGFYTYHIYSMVDPTNLDLANITELVEMGKVYVNDTIKPIKKSYTGGNNTKTVYNG
jgi:hypothetical protein